MSPVKSRSKGIAFPRNRNYCGVTRPRLGLAITQEFLDVESAKTTGRPGFAAMASFLQQRRECRVVLVEKTDRLYRNLKDYVTMDDLDVEIHMVKENEILSKSSRSAQKFMHGIRVLMAKNYIDNLSEEVKKGLHTKAAQSLWPSFAPPGYCNAAGDGGKRIIVPDPVVGTCGDTPFRVVRQRKLLAQDVWPRRHMRKDSGSARVATKFRSPRYIRFSANGSIRESLSMAA